MIKGISVCNPVDIERDYLLFTVDYAIEHAFDHMQFIGPIHDPVKGNLDGMTEYRKYSQFNNTKDMDYVRSATADINEACEKASAAGIKTYVWHHELDLPTGFGEAYPEILNDYGDVEVTHPLVRDFLEHKLIDFFHDYPKIDGLILTLHETKVPLLKLKNQKLDKIGRVKYVTKILFDTCKSLGKELIVRPFASIPEDYDMMMQAYEEISHDLLIMDKWTQFDWSLTLPNNAFYKKIKNNPLFVETDIFGEFFGKGRLPLMLKDHIIEKFAYCENFSPAGYVSRIDRAGRHPFGDVNQVNIDIMNACMNGKNADDAAKAFFAKKYPNAASEVMELMAQTEDILRKIIYLKGYYFSELSLFPSLNHSKNHFYFEMMRKNYAIASNEWFIPIGWDRGSMQSVTDEKESAATLSKTLLQKLEQLADKIAPEDYKALWTKFCNLRYVAEIWNTLVHIFINYVRYFETKDVQYKQALEQALDAIIALRDSGRAALGDKFYCDLGDIVPDDAQEGFIGCFVADVRKSFAAECAATDAMEKLPHLTDYVICGGAMEGHKLQKEVNFSDTLLIDGKLCRIPGNRRGMKWSTINAHGWFSYELCVRPNTENAIHVVLGSSTEDLQVQITIGDTLHTLTEKISGTKEFVLPYSEQAGKDTVRIRFDRISKDTPCVYTISVQ